MTAKKIPETPMIDSKFVRDRFEQICANQKVSIRWLAEATGFNRYYINKLIRGDIRKGKDVDRLRVLIEKMGYSEEQFFQGGVMPGVKANRGTIPLYGEIPAGNPVWVEGVAVADAWVEVPPQSAGRRLFALRVRGDSMLPRFKSGDLVYLEPLAIKLGVKDPANPVPRLTFERLHNRVVAAIVDGEATLKLLKLVPRAKPGKSDDYELHLVPLNEAYSPIIVGPDSTAEFQGVVVKLFRDEP
jgi:SOS-response transcriptional repressor LexA